MSDHIVSIEATRAGARMELHPLCTLFPRMSGAEFDALKADIAANGLRSPIVVHDGQVLDGGNRYAACLAIGVEPALVQFAGDDAVSFVLSVNFHRRHLSAGQQAAVVAAAQDWGRAQNHGGDRSKVQPLHLETVADRAKASGASVRTQKMADKVAKQSPDLARKVAHGEISLAKAIDQLAPPTEMPFSSPPSASEPTLAELAATEDDVDEDDTPDLITELARSEREIGGLRIELEDANSRIAALSGNEAGLVIEAIRIELDQVRSLGELRFNELATAKRENTQFKSLLERLRKLAGVTTNSDLCDFVAHSRAKAA